jgi:predicted RNase H-like HicB family nuclease
MTTRRNDFDLTIVYQHAEGDHWTACVPSVAGTISFGATRDQARENVLDALGEMLSLEPASVPTGATTERLSVALLLGRGLSLER